MRIFSGEGELAQALTALCAPPGCEAPLVLVQDFVPNNLEMRVYLVRGEIAHTVYSDFDVDNWYERQRDGGFTKGPESFSMCGRAEAVAQWLEADEACMQHAEEQARALVATWLLWLRAVATDTPPTIRIDLLVTRTAPGHAEIHSLELTEAGFSLLGWRGGPPAVMGALLDACFEDSGPTEAEAALLAAFRARQLAAVPPEEPSHTRFVDHCGEGGCYGHHTCAAGGAAGPDAAPAAEAVMYDSDDAPCLRPALSERPRGRGRGRS